MCEVDKGGKKVKYHRNVYRCLVLITQFGISMLVPIFLCSFLGIYLDRKFGTQFLMVLLSGEGFDYLFDLTGQLLQDAVLMIIAVFVLFLVASHFLFNPARDMLKKRQEKIKGELDDAKESMESADALKAEYEDKLKNVEKEAEDILTQARKKALENENRIIAEAKNEAAVIIKQARMKMKIVPI